MTVETNGIENQLLRVFEGLPVDRRMEVLDFAMFLQAQESQQPDQTFQPVQRLEDLFGHFWPDRETVDEFADAVRRWRHEDIELHRDLE